MGGERGVPWGISESGYNPTDAQLNYQYRAFGVPGLGFKRGLADDLVIAPYATVMAMMLSPEEAAANLQRLMAEGVMGRYGFYEAIDYTPARVPAGQTRVVVRSFMAHHEGMSLLSLAYAMLDQPMQRRFLADPLLRGIDAFAARAGIRWRSRCIRTSAGVPEKPQQRAGVVRGRRCGVLSSPNTPVPEVHLLIERAVPRDGLHAGSGWTPVE